MKFHQAVFIGGEESDFQLRIAVKVHSDEPHGTAAPGTSRLSFRVSNSRVARD